MRGIMLSPPELVAVLELNPAGTVGLSMLAFLRRSRELRRKRRI